MKGKFATKLLDYVIVLCPIMVMDANVSEHTDQKYEVYIIYFFGIQLPSVTHFDNHYIVTSCPGIIDECNSNGNCNKNNGVCECFDGYGGDSCES